MTGTNNTNASYSEPDFRAHLLGGLLYAAGRDGQGGMLTTPTPTDPASGIPDDALAWDD